MIIDLDKDPLYRDCETCQEPSKRVWSRTMDVDGPGVPGVLYRCDNSRCRAYQNEIAKYIMRRAMNDETETDD